MLCALRLTPERLTLRTTKPFSTISYNSVTFLKSELDKLEKRRVISFYAFVYHYAEQDEKKDHIHLIIFPNGQVDTDSITDTLIEPDFSNPLKPLGVMPWKSSKWEDWYLYCSHNSGYLASKNQTREYHYDESDFVCPYPDYLHELVHTIDYSKYAKTQEFVDRALAGETFEAMVLRGQIPVPQFHQWKALYEFITNSECSRDERVSHSPK